MELAAMMFLIPIPAVDMLLVYRLHHPNTVKADPVKLPERNYGADIFECSDYFQQNQTSSAPSPSLFAILIAPPFIKPWI